MKPNLAVASADGHGLRCSVARDTDAMPSARSSPVRAMVGPRPPWHPWTGLMRFERYARLVCVIMAGIVLRVRLTSGDQLDVTYEEPDAVGEDEVIDHVVSALTVAMTCGRVAPLEPATARRARHPARPHAPALARPPRQPAQRRTGPPLRHVHARMGERTETERPLHIPRRGQPDMPDTRHSHMTDDELEHHG